MQLCRSSWLSSGRLSHLATDFSAGVYLFVHAGPPRRVIYVGTARRSSGFTPRWCGHLSLFACGGRTVWRPRDGSDVYALMAAEPARYAGFCSDGLVWMPGSTRVDGFYAPLVGDAGGYAEHWRDWVLSEYLDRISVWRCRMESDELSLILESRIQLAFREAFGISYYTKSGAQSWLGRVEVTDPARLSSVRFEFAEVPHVEPESRRLLADLPHGASVI